ncbi:hypothetical protein AX15_007926 [Amanita polypyramis BW_CC]|nr:hypothetical protein AX15_007926 [Amanita polypyramis BW_CC]
MIGSGSGSSLPVPVLVLAGVCTLVAVLVSAMSIYLQLKNYRKPLLQRMVVRIMLMIPIYAVASLISLFSLEAAFVIDAIRDIYEAFVIYCFFSLLLSYLGGERSLLILLNGRPPKTPPFPVSIFKRELDVSDPHTFLFLKRGIIQYVQVKPVLAAAILILKACGWYNDGDFRANSGYLYITIIYNISICLALYCLAMFWLCINEDLKPFRPIPKFLCIKGILFFSFWQSVIISILVAAKAITRLGPYTDAEHISLGLTDTLICIEMPFFALAHLYAFNYSDYIDPKLHFCARMPIRYSFFDAFSIKDVVEDTKATVGGEGMDYREFEPAEGEMHQGAGRDRRIKAGLRYTKGGKNKYWLPRARADVRSHGRVGRVVTTDPVDIHAPLLGRQAYDTTDEQDDPMVWDSHHHDDEDVGGNAPDGYELPFGDLDSADDALFDHCRQYVFGDYNYPVIDVSDEGARTAIWHEEERVLRNERGAWRSAIRNVQVGIRGKVWEGYGAVGATEARGSSPSRKDSSTGKTVESAHTPDVRVHWDQSPAHDTDGTRTRPSLYVPDVQRVRMSPSPTPSTASSGIRHGNSSTSGGGPSTSSPPSSKSKSTSESFTKVKYPVRSPLPPDAVDLVVEDGGADKSKEQGGGRRASEPFLRKGLRKVHQQESGDGTSAARVDEEGSAARARPASKNGTERQGKDETTKGTADFEGGVPGRVWEPEYSPPSSSPPRVRQEERIIARESTPPARVRMLYGDMEDHNPWA